MFHLVTEQDAAVGLAFPGVDINGATAAGPLVNCGHHPNLGGFIYLTPLQVCEAVHTIAPVLGDDKRRTIAANVGAIPFDEAAELRAEVEELRERLKLVEPVVDAVTRAAREYTLTQDGDVVSAKGRVVGNVAAA